MPEERHWIAVVAPERYATERLYARDALLVPGGGELAQPGDAGDPAEAGDPVALVAATRPPVLFGLGRVREADGGGTAPRADVWIAYTHRLLDDPRPVAGDFAPGLTEVSARDYETLTSAVGADRPTDRTEWFVSVALPIEAASPAEAVREFWTYVDKLGPGELPAFVWPRGDELAMQAFVLGEEANLDPEED